MLLSRFSAWIHQQNWTERKTTKEMTDNISDYCIVLELSLYYVWRVANNRSI